MTATTLEERRRQIADIKDSFNHLPLYSKQYKDVGIPISENMEGSEMAGSFLKKMIFAILLFAAFLALDKSGFSVLNQNSQTVSAFLEESSFDLEVWREMMEAYMP